jgi:TBC1 domain family member 2B
VAVIEKHFQPHYFDNGLIGAQADQECLKEIIKIKLPDLSEHLELIEIDLSSITLNWFLAIFIDSVPFESLLRIWDCFLLEGNKVLFRYSCALLYMHKYGLLEQRDTISMFKQLKSAAKGTYDVDGLTKVINNTTAAATTKTTTKRKKCSN